MMKMMTKAKEQMTRFLREEDAVGVIEMLLLLVEKYFISYSL